MAPFVLLALATSRGFAAPALLFEQNLGQTDPAVAFVARASGRTIYITPDAWLIASAGGSLRMRLRGAGPARQVLGEGEPRGLSHYYLGPDPACWVTDVPAYARVRAFDLLPGVDVVFHSSASGSFEYDLELAPGGSVGDLRLELEGADSIAVDADGALVVSAGGEEFRQLPPVAYQEDSPGGCREPVAARFRVEPDGAVGFTLDHFDRSRPLVIDPVLRNSTWWGGSDEDRFARLELHLSFPRIVGSTRSLDFPTRSPLQAAPGGGRDAFVTLLDDTGTSVAISSYFGGSGDDEAADVSIDLASFGGTVMVTGATRSADFPVSTGAPQPVYGGGPSDAFVVLFDQFGRLGLSTYLGGSGRDEGRAIVKAGAYPAVAGITESTDFPLRDALQPALAGASDAFLTLLGGPSTYLGGSGADEAVELAFLSGLTSEITLLGATDSPDFPATPGAFQETPAGGRDAFLARFAADGRSVLSATLLGGSGDERPSDLVINYVTGEAWFIATTDSSDLPAPGFQPALAGGTDAYVAGLSPRSTALLGATYLGGSDDEEGQSIDLDLDGSRIVLWLAGTTRSADFPLRSPLQAACASCPGGRDAFWARIAADGSELRCASYLGGSGDESGVLGIKSSFDVAWLGGTTDSTDLPVVQALQPAFAGGASDVFLAGLGCTRPADLGNSLRATQDRAAGEVVLEWNTASGLDGYRLYSSTSERMAPETAEGSTAAASLRLPFPFAPAVYYKVRGVNCCGEGP